MRIALVTSSFDPHVGGVEEHVKHIARELVCAGDDIEVWTVDRGEALGERLIDGIRVRYLPTPLPARTVPAMLRFGLRAPAAWRHWRRAAREFRPDVLHVHCFGPNGVYALRLHRVTGIPLAITSHGETLGDDNSAYARSRLLRDSLTSALRSAVLVTAPSNYVLNDLRRTYGLDGGVIVPNGVDLSVEAAPLPPARRPYVFAVGRLGYMKGFDLLIDAFAQSGLAETRDLIIGGDGPEKERLLHRAIASDVIDQVRLPGRLTPEEVAAYMEDATCVVVPSRSEAFGVVALEAWRAGSALVITTRGGGAEFVHDGVDGLLVDPEDAGELTAALLRIAQDDALRGELGRAGRARVSQCSWDGVACAYRRLFAQRQGVL